MASCTRCGATLVAQARFCAACGTPVVHASVVPPGAQPRRMVDSAPDPYGKTVRRDDEADPGEAAPTAPVSPLAASVMAAKTSVPPPVTPPQGQGQPFPGYAPGTPVLVFWADGNRYRGTVLHVSAQHVFVAFPNGIQQWIDARYVTAGG